jgi:hypothetical protein
MEIANSFNFAISIFLEEGLFIFPFSGQWIPSGLGHETWQAKRTSPHRVHDRLTAAD